MPTSEKPFTYTYFNENLTVGEWNATDAVPFIKWYRNNPENSKWAMGRRYL